MTDEEYKKFQELVEKELREKKEGELKKELFIQELSKKVDILLDLNKSYGPVEAYAVTFAKKISLDFVAHKIDRLWFSWNEMQNYLTDVCLEKDKSGKKKLKKSFRELLLERGIKTQVNRKYNTFEVRKCKPRPRKMKQ